MAQRLVEYKFLGRCWVQMLTFGGEAANELSVGLSGPCSPPAELLERHSQSHDFRLASVCLIASRVWPLAVYYKGLQSLGTKYNWAPPLRHEQCHSNGSAACCARRPSVQHGDLGPCPPILPYPAFVLHIRFFFACNISHTVAQRAPPHPVLLYDPSNRRKSRRFQFDAPGHHTAPTRSPAAEAHGTDWASARWTCARRADTKHLWRKSLWPRRQQRPAHPTPPSYFRLSCRLWR